MTERSVAKFSLKSGYAYRRRDGETEWETVILPRAEEGNARMVAIPITIDGAPCAAFSANGEHGVLYAQTLVMCVDPETVPNATEGQPAPTKASSK